MNDELLEKLQEIVEELRELEDVFYIDIHTRMQIRDIVLELEVITEGVKEDRE